MTVKCLALKMQLYHIVVMERCNQIIGNSSKQVRSKSLNQTVYVHVLKSVKKLYFYEVIDQKQKHTILVLKEKLCY